MDKPGERLSAVDMKTSVINRVSRRFSPPPVFIRAMEGHHRGNTQFAR